MDQVNSVGPYITALGTTGGGSTNTVINAITTDPFYQPGTYLKLTKRITEVAAVYYVLYK